MISEIVGQPSFEPVWGPLEAAISNSKCGGWMYMAGYSLACGVTVHSYKHSITRNYVNFSEDGRAWVFVGDDGYQEISRDTAIDLALAVCAESSE